MHTHREIYGCVWLEIMNFIFIAPLWCLLLATLLVSNKSNKKTSYCFHFLGHWWSFTTGKSINESGSYNVRGKRGYSVCRFLSNQIKACLIIVRSIFYISTQENESADNKVSLVYLPVSSFYCCNFVLM